MDSFWLPVALCFVGGLACVLPALVLFAVGLSMEKPTLRRRRGF